MQSIQNGNDVTQTKTALYTKAEALSRDLALDDKFVNLDHLTLLEWVPKVGALAGS